MYTQANRKSRRKRIHTNNAFAAKVNSSCPVIYVGKEHGAANGSFHVAPTKLLVVAYTFWRVVTTF